MCNINKYYALSDNTIIQYEDCVHVVGVTVQNDYLYEIGSLCEILGWTYIVDYEKKQIEIDGTFEVLSFYEPVFPKMVSNHLWITDGSYKKADELWGEDYRGKFSATLPENPIEVVGGQTFCIDYFLSWIPEVAGILFLDDTGNVVQFINSNSSVSVQNVEIVVPQGATKMQLTYYGNGQYRLRRKIDRLTSCEFLAEQGNYEEKRLQVMEDSAKNSWKNLSMWFNKGYVTFVLDDCRPDMDRVAAIFAEYEVPLCIAAVWESMHAASSAGEYTRMEICQQIVANGGEILAHDAEVLTAERLTDIAAMEKHFVLDKYYLEQCGFDVDGIILAGGKGQVAGSRESDLWCRNFYLYSDLYGDQNSGEPYFHGRFWLGNCLDDYERIINEAIAQKKWVSLYFHDLKEVNEDKLREILEYVTSVSDGLEVVTYETVYNSIYGAE